MRGLRSQGISQLANLRYNPAYAGTTRAISRCRRFMRIQPRVCGDYNRVTGPAVGLQDTTPRMRGLPVIITLKEYMSRYNPAYAGTTAVRDMQEKARKIQPRVCGDYDRLVERDDRTKDTTPRMRGLRDDLALNRWRLRYNPAYAGTTASSSFFSCIAQIQPRVCGDYGWSATENL